MVPEVRNPGSVLADPHAIAITGTLYAPQGRGPVQDVEGETPTFGQQMDTLPERKVTPWARGMAE